MSRQIGFKFGLRLVRQSCQLTRRLDLRKPSTRLVVVRFHCVQPNPLLTAIESVEFESWVIYCLTSSGDNGVFKMGLARSKMMSLMRSASGVS